MRFLLLTAWPALIPLLLYLLWMLYRRRKAAAQEEELPPFLSGPWGWAVASSLVILAISLFTLGLTSESDDRASYSPKRFEDGKLIEETLD